MNYVCAGNINNHWERFLWINNQHRYVLLEPNFCLIFSFWRDSSRHSTTAVRQRLGSVAFTDSHRSALSAVIYRQIDNLSIELCVVRPRRLMYGLPDVLVAAEWSSVTTLPPRGVCWRRWQGRSTRPLAPSRRVTDRGACLLPRSLISSTIRQRLATLEVAIGIAWLRDVWAMNNAHAREGQRTNDQWELLVLVRNLQ